MAGGGGAQGRGWRREGRAGWAADGAGGDRARGAGSGLSSRRPPAHPRPQPGPAMPIVEKLREALKPGRREQSEDGELGRLLAASAKKVLLQRIEFEPASRGLSGQLELLRGKYRPLNASAGPAAPRPPPPEGPSRKHGAYRAAGGGWRSRWRPPPAAHRPPSLRRRSRCRGWRPRAAEGAVPRRAALLEVGARAAGGRRAAQPGQHLLPQRHAAVPHLHAAARLLPAVQGAQPRL